MYNLEIISLQNLSQENNQRLRAAVLQYQIAEVIRLLIFQLCYIESPNSSHLCKQGKEEEINLTAVVFKEVSSGHIQDQDRINSLTQILHIKIKIIQFNRELSLSRTKQIIIGLLCLPRQKTMPQSLRIVNSTLYIKQPFLLQVFQSTECSQPCEEAFMKCFYRLCHVQRWYCPLILPIIPRAL